MVREVAGDVTADAHLTSTEFAVHELVRPAFIGLLMFG
jgi:hypothetical protein